MNMDLIDPTLTKTFGRALAEAAKTDERIVALAADVGNSTGLWEFKKVFPARFFEIGVAEQNMMGIAAGMATCGFRPFVSSFGCFAALRACEQVRTDICYGNQDVKVVGTHAGLSFGPGGTTHHVTEDIAVMRSFANMTILVPADSLETAMTVLAAAQHKGPCYIRLPRGPRPHFYGNCEACQFEIGRAQELRSGNDVTIIACGMPVIESVHAAAILGKDGIHARVLNMSTVKPVDKDAIIRAATETGAIVTVEEHNIMGGLGDAVASVVVENCPVPMKMVGIPDIFSTIGPSEQLYELYGLTAAPIAATVRQLLAKKNKPADISRLPAFPSVRPQH